VFGVYSISKWWCFSRHIPALRAANTTREDLSNHSSLFLTAAKASKEAAASEKGRSNYRVCSRPSATH